MRDTISRRTGGRRARILALAAVGVLAVGSGAAAGIAGGDGAAAAPATAGTGVVAGGTGAAASVDVPEDWSGTISADEISDPYLAERRGGRRPGVLRGLRRLLLRQRRPRRQRVDLHLHGR